MAKKEEKVLGVPAKKRSGFARVSSAKKPTHPSSGRSNPSRISSVNQGVWHLCVLIGMNAAAAIYKMDRREDFRIIHSLNKLLKTDVLPVEKVFPALAIVGAAKGRSEAKRRTGAKRTTAKRGAARATPNPKK